MRKFMLILAISAMMVFGILSAFADEEGTLAGGSTNQIDPGANTLTGGIPGCPPIALYGPWKYKVSGTETTQCAADRTFGFTNTIHVGQWMATCLKDNNQEIWVTKPGIYMIPVPMKFRLSSNGKVVAKFTDDTNTNWDAPYASSEALRGREETIPLNPQMPVDKRYTIVAVGPGVTADTIPFQQSPSKKTGNIITFANTKELHGSYLEYLPWIVVPIVGFDMYMTDIVYPCNSAGKYAMKGHVDLTLANQQKYIDPITGELNFR